MAVASIASSLALAVAGSGNGGVTFARKNDFLDDSFEVPSLLLKVLRSVRIDGIGRIRAVHQRFSVAKRTGCTSDESIDLSPRRHVERRGNCLVPNSVPNSRCGPAESAELVRRPAKRRRARHRLARGVTGQRLGGSKRARARLFEDRQHRLVARGRNAHLQLIPRSDAAVGGCRLRANRRSPSQRSVE